VKSDSAVYTAAVYFTAFIVVGLLFWLQLGPEAAVAIMATVAAGALGMVTWSAIRKARHRRRS
jgi:hypothetical protein